MPNASLLKIMIVDDQRVMRTLVQSSAQQLGIGACIQAEDGEEALRLLESRQAHLVLSDLNMPKLDGLGLLRAVRQHPRLKDLHFIMLTSRGDSDLVREAVGLRVNNYLMKPFSLEGLRIKIEAVLGPLT